MKKQSGFSLVESLLIAVVLTVVGFGGWYVWSRDNNQDIAQENTTYTSSSNKEGQETENKLELNDTVSVLLPDNWTASLVKGSACYMTVDTDPNKAPCVVGGTLLPDEKLRTKYGDGSEYFTVQISLYENSDNMLPKLWLQEKLLNDGDTSFENDSISAEKINGYDALYARTTGTVYDEVWYIITANAKTVLITARTYEPAMLEDGSTIGDFRKFEPQIKAIAESIDIH